MSFYGEVYEYGSLYNESMAERMIFPVKSVKLRMQDHPGHFVRLPMMRFVNEKWGISKIPGITPNLISGLHLFVAIIAGKLRERETERQRETKRERQRQRDRETETERDRDRDKQTDRDRDRETETERDRYIHTHTQALLACYSFTK